jgi:hypothetical protein
VSPKDNFKKTKRNEWAASDLQAKASTRAAISWKNRNGSKLRGTICWGNFFIVMIAYFYWEGLLWRIDLRVASASRVSRYRKSLPSIYVPINNHI